MNLSPMREVGCVGAEKDTDSPLFPVLPVIHVYL